MTLRNKIIRLAHEKPHLRNKILPLLKVAEGEEESASSSGGGVSGLYLKFLEEEGDRKEKNPDTGHDAKIKNWKGEKGKAKVKKMFESWKEKQEKKDKGEKKPAPKKEEPKKDAPKKEEAKSEKKKETKSEPTREPKETIDIQKAFGAYGRKVDLEWQFKNKIPGTKKPEEIAKAVDQYKDRMTTQEKKVLQKTLKSKANMAEYKAEQKIKKDIEKMIESQGHPGWSADEILSYIKGESSDISDSDTYAKDYIPSSAKKELEDAAKASKTLSDAAGKLASSFSLRTDLIRLAYQKPELRKDLLPLLK